MVKTHIFVDWFVLKGGHVETAIRWNLDSATGFANCRLLENRRRLAIIQSILSNGET